MKATRISATAMAIAAAAGLTLPAAAPATTVKVSGTQTVVDEAAGTFKMAGSLVGDWATTSFHVLAKAPLYRARGTERFTGCLDTGRDGSCSGDPAGTVRFAFTYSAKFGPGNPPALVWGACMHPVSGGTGAFAGARGVITMVDTATPTGVETSYIGNLTYGSSGTGAGSHGRARARAAAGPRGCATGG